jgi:hypothetical protein
MMLSGSSIQGRCRPTGFLSQGFDWQVPLRGFSIGNSLHGSTLRRIPLYGEIVASASVALSTI